MKDKRSFATRVREAFWPVAVDREVDEEIAEHIELQTRRYIEQGMTPGAARNAAIRRFGNVDAIRGECVEIRTGMEVTVQRQELVQELRQDISFAVRTLRKSPLFTLVALVTLAIGVGATTAIFSVVNAVLLRSLPYRDADRTMLIWNGYRQSGLEQAAVSGPEYFDFKEQLRSVDAVAAFTRQPSNLVGDGEPERLMAYVVSPNVFDLLGAQPQVGRGFHVDDGVATSEKVILISHALWMRRFGGDRAVLGRKVNIGGRIRTIVGVMPSEVRFPDAPLGFLREPADLWIPSSWEQVRGDERGNQNLAILARLRPGATEAQFRADLTTLGSLLRAQVPDRYEVAAKSGWRFVSVPLRDQMVGSVRRSLLVLSGAVAIVLLIACVNVANLLLARGASRRREMAVRAALGAGRGRLVRQLLTESALLAVSGGMLGLFLAWAGVRALTRLEPGSIPRLEGVAIDERALLFSIVASVLTGVLVGLVPALQQSGGDGRSMLGDGARGSSDGAARQRLRSVLVVAEVAMAMIILVAAGLLGRSFIALQAVHPGFVPRNVLSLQLGISRAKYDSAYKIAALATNLQARVSALPGVTRGSAIYPLPMSGEGWGGSFIVDGEPTGPANPEPHAEYASAAPGYFGTMGIALRSGRDFTAQDAIGAPEVVVVDELLARKHWPNESAIGKRINVVGRREGLWATVIGVVAHVHSSSPQQEGEPQIYLPFLQRPQPVMSLVVRTQVEPTSLAASVRDAVRATDAELPVIKLRSMERVVSGVVAGQRFNTLLIVVFGAAALLLASVGLYGVMAYLVSQRTREIGIRVALGGRPRDVRIMVMRQSMRIAGLGLGVGVLVSLALTRAMRGLLFGISPTDIPTYLAISLLLAFVAVVAALGPARRATRVDPTIALRAE